MGNLKSFNIDILSTDDLQRQEEVEKLSHILQMVSLRLTLTKSNYSSIEDSDPSLGDFIVTQSFDGFWHQLTCYLLFVESVRDKCVEGKQSRCLRQ